MSMAISVRIQPLTGRKAGGQRRHDTRDPSHIPDYVDRSRLSENSVIIAPPDPASVRAEIASNRQAAGQQRLRADARIVAVGVITFGTEAQGTVAGLQRNEQDHLYRRIAERISVSTGHELLGLVVHRDESAPHAHFTLRGYRRDAKGKEVPLRLNPVDLARLQDVAAAEVAHLGIARGKSKQQRVDAGEDRSKYIHRSVADLHCDLPQEIEAAKNRRQAAELEAEAAEARRTKNERLAEKAWQDLERGKGDVEAVQKRLETYARRAEEAKSEKERLETELSKLDAAASGKRKVAAQVRKEMPALPYTKQLLSKNMTVSNEDLDTYHAQVAEYIRDTVVGMAKHATRDAEAAIKQREVAVQQREDRLDQREYEMDEYKGALALRERRLDNYDQLYAENRKLKERLDTIGINVGHILGVPDASMNRGKTLRAVEASASMQGFQKSLREQKVSAGQSKDLGLKW